MPKSKEEQKLQEKANRLYRTYGITIDDWNYMAEDGCWICKRKDGRLCVDHIHVRKFKQMEPEDKQKYVRGILCFMCNVGLKGFEKTVDGKRNRKQLEGTYKYFQTFKLKGEI